MRSRGAACVRLVLTTVQVLPSSILYCASLYKLFRSYRCRTAALWTVRPVPCVGTDPPARPLTSWAACGETTHVRAFPPRGVEAGMESR